MAVKNMEQIIKQTHPKDHCDLTIEELTALINKANGPDKYGAIYDAFKYGYALGQRAERRTV